MSLWSEAKVCRYGCRVGKSSVIFTITHKQQRALCKLLEGDMICFTLVFLFCFVFTAKETQKWSKI